MSRSRRVYVIVGLLAASAAGVTVGATALTADRPEPGSAAKPRAGAPPLALDLGVRVDPEARALRRAQDLYERGRRREAEALFGRHSSAEARIGLAFARWPTGTLDAVEAIARERPGSALARLHHGFVLFWLRRDAAAQTEWQAAARVQPDSASAVRANDLLHPDFAPGLPIFVPSFRPPAGLARLPPPRQLAVLEARARRPDARARILYGVALQRLGRPLSARRQFEAAVLLAPADAEALTAAAVGRFTKDAPARAFSRLGPLTRRFPRAATVRFHLGLLLLWLARVDEARRQLRSASAQDPDGPVGAAARTFLARLPARTGTG
ncbi:MAG: hypothetical protein ABR521_08010 [Gaiellaceae bacterium]